MAGALIGALRVSLSAETTAFEAGMKRSQRQAATTASSIKRSFDGVKASLAATATGFVAALGIGSLIRAGSAALEYAGHLGELADTLGLTTKDLQTFSYAAGQVGISQEELEAGIQKLTISMGKAQLGSKAQAEAFKAIGISLDQLKGKNAGDVFRLIAEKLETVSDRSQRAAVEVALFGKAGAKLDNLLSGSQGRLDELSAAAEKLGIILSDEQIQKADATADKIAALQTVLKAQIASEVADNADAILGLANALSVLIRAVGQSVTGWRILIAEFKAAGNAIANLQNPFTAADQAGAAIRAGGVAYGVGSVTTKLPPPKLPTKPLGTGSIGQFLAGGAPKAKKAKEDHTAERLARQAYEYQRDELSAQRDILDAKKNLSTDYVEQTTLEIEILDLERQQYRAELDYQVQQNKQSKGQEGINQAQADHLLALYDQADSDKRQKVLNEEQEQRLRDTAMLEEHDYDRKRELIEKQADLATTQSERRKIELDLLELAYQEKKQALERIMQNSKDEAAIEDARRDLLNLQANHALDRQKVFQQTRGPLEDYLAGIPHTADQVNEALQNLEVQGIEGLVDALSHVGEGWKAMRDIALHTIQDIVSALIKMQIQKMLFSVIGQASGIPGGFNAASATDFSGSFGDFAGTLPVFADGGGPVKGPGTARSDSILARLSNGEFVMNAMTVGKFGVPFFHAMNAGKITPDALQQGGRGGGMGFLKYLSPVAALASTKAGGILKYLSPAALIASKFADGGYVGRSLPIAKVSMGGRLNIGNDNHRASSRQIPPFVFNNYARMSSDEARRTGAQAAAGWNAEIAKARTKGII